MVTLPASSGRSLRQASFHAVQPRGPGTTQREPSRGSENQKGDKFLHRIRPHTSAVPAWNEAFQMLTHCVRQQPNGEVLYDAAPPGTEVLYDAPVEPAVTPTSRDGVAGRETPRNSESPTFSQVLFFLPLRDSGSTETAVRMSLRCPQVCATGRL